MGTELDCRDWLKKTNFTLISYSILRTGSGAKTEKKKKERRTRTRTRTRKTDRFGEYLFGTPIIAYDFRNKVCRKLKTGVFFSADFRDIGNVMPVVFGEVKNVVLGTKKGQLAFSERQQQLVNSGNNISFPRIF